METQVHELTLGQVKVTVEAPEGVPLRDVHLSLRPKTVEEFEAAVEVLGGRDRVRMPQRDPGYYDTPAHVDRERAGDVSLGGSIYPPPRDAVPGLDAPTPAPHPFFGRYAQGAEA